MVEGPDVRVGRELLGSSPRVLPSPRRAPLASSARRTSAYVCVSSTPGAKRVAPLVKSGSFRSAARSRTMATGGLERAPALLGLAERLDAPEWVPDLPDRREVGESSRELPPPKMRSRARSYAASRTSSFLSRLAFPLAALSPSRRRPSRARDPLAPASTPRGFPPAGSSLRRTTTRGAGPWPPIARESLSRRARARRSRRARFVAERAGRSRNFLRAPSEKRSNHSRAKGAGHPHLAPVDFSASAVSDGHFQIRFLTETLCAVDAVWQKFPNR